MKRQTKKNEKKKQMLSCAAEWGRLWSFYSLGVSRNKMRRKRFCLCI